MSLALALEIQVAKRYSKTAFPLMILGTVAICGSVLIALKLPSLQWRAEQFAQEPQQMTLDELAANGPGDNRHLIVTDFVCAKNFYLQSVVRKGSRPDPNGTTHRQAWIPLFPKPPGVITTKGLDPEPPTFNVLLLTPNELVGRDIEIHMLSRRSSVQGLVKRVSESRVPDDAKRHFRAQYPESDVESCWLLEAYHPHERKDASFFMYAAAIGAVVCFLVGGGAVYIGIREHRRVGRPTPPPLPTS